ncbi:adenylosuccinate synthase [Natranaerofaba carboxydovora]|uniref:adenylosuccinate synthase n=1 Tax=Natranaerofaba carboxydovora TaxID=2742683 RepID=UPI001F13DA73|nr:adenylosuccinate synthase [Natranaerofaba carboxydovora]UMZ75160.1 Adenylosuccinate synthetase [Natranaerofaba carboxydovora]
MSSVVIVGTQWGDEGKGKITDFLAEKSDVITRYQGGNNAGHTVKIADKEYKLHLIPSGIFYPDKMCVLGNGMVIDLEALISELDYLEENGVTVKNLIISDRAHLIMPYHKVLDELDEERRDQEKIGTTKKGIGPCYMDKAARKGIRVCDLLEPEILKKKIENSLKEKNQLLDRVYDSKAFDPDKMVADITRYAERIKPFIGDSSYYINTALENGEKLLFEGAQGTLLDLDHGTYPFVTSSNPVAGGVCIGAGIGPTNITNVLGVLKAYSTRVGDGPFPSELKDDIGDKIREAGGEFGTTTGRPRRIGWLDLVIARYAKRVSGLDQIALTLLDVLSGFEKLKLCVAYKYKGETLKEFPASLEVLSKCEPVLEELPGWEEDITGIESYDDLPTNAKNYLKRIEEICSVPISVISVGPGRDQTKIIKDIF